MSSIEDRRMQLDQSIAAHRGHMDRVNTTLNRFVPELVSVAAPATPSDHRDAIERFAESAHVELAGSATAAGANADELLIAWERDGRVDDLRRALDIVGLPTRRVTLAPDWAEAMDSPLLLWNQSRALSCAVPDRRGRARLRPGNTAIGETLTHCTEALAPVVVCDRRQPASIADLVGIGLRGQRGLLARAMLWLLVAALASLAPIALAGVIVGQIIPSADRTRLITVTIAALLLAGAAAVSTLVAGQHLSALRTRFDRTASLAGWHRLMSLPAPFFGNWTVGELTTRASTIPLVRQAFGTPAMLGIGAAIAGVVALPTLLAAGLNVTAAVALALAVAVAATAVVARAQYRRVRRINDAANAATGLLLPMIYGATRLRIADATDRTDERWVSRFAVQLKAQLFQPQIWLGAISTALPTVTIAIIATLFVADPRIDQSVFLAAVAAAVALSSSVSVIISLVPGAAEARAGLDQIGPVLTSVPESTGRQHLVGDLSGRLDVDDISFRYSDDGPLIIDRVSFSASPGEFIALVGGSGAGKSTLLRLLLGFETPTTGAIAYDGFDLSEIDPLGVRRQIATILQNARLLPGSLAENITSGRPASEADLWQALEAVGFADDVRRLPMGLQTAISDQGGGLSGGQRQRVLLARALYGKPRLLLLDEATSALDNLTQAMVTESINGLGITRVVIAHRLSTIEGADTIHVLEHGRIVESGTYAELIAADGTFAELVARQRL